MVIDLCFLPKPGVVFGHFSERKGFRSFQHRSDRRGRWSFAAKPTAETQDDEEEKCALVQKHGPVEDFAR